MRKDYLLEGIRNPKKAVEYAIKGATDRAVSHLLSSSSEIFTKKYYISARRFYRKLWKETRDIRLYPKLIDPTKYILIDPQDIKKIVAAREQSDSREDVMHGIEGDIGRIVKRHDTLKDIEKSSYHFRSTYNHFKYDIPWEQTELYEKNMKKIRGKTPGRRWISKEHMMRDLHAYDNIYRDTVNGKYKTQIQLALLKPNNRRPYKKLLTNEIMIDIGPKGELYLVDSVHRLAIAKAAQKSVPAVVIARNHRWVSRRQKVKSGRREPICHPDIPHEQRAEK